MTREAALALLESALAHVRRLSKRYQSRATRKALRTIREELAAGLDLLVNDSSGSESTPQRAGTPSGTRPLKIPGPPAPETRHVGPSPSVQRRIDATPPLWSATDPRVTHLYCGRLPPWDAALGAYRNFTAEEKTAGLICQPLTPPPTLPPPVTDTP